MSVMIVFLRYAKLINIIHISKFRYAFVSFGDVMVLKCNIVAVPIQVQCNSNRELDFYWICFYDSYFLVCQNL